VGRARYGRCVLEPVEFPPDAAAVLSRCRRAGVVLDFVLLRGIDGQDEEHAHRVAAVVGVAQAAVRRDAAWAVECGSVDPETLVGRRLSLAEFYGPRSDPATGALRAEQPVGWRPHFVDGRGFVDALLDPPYGLHPSRDGHFSGALDTGALLRDVVSAVLCAPGADTPIWHWNGDWCRYFDAGRDWWGASAWTIRTGGTDIVTIAASTTD